MCPGIELPHEYANESPSQRAAVFDIWYAEFEGQWEEYTTQTVSLELTDCYGFGSGGPKTECLLASPVLLL